jgi:hypothetical protein
MSKFAFVAFAAILVVQPALAAKKQQPQQAYGEQPYGEQPTLRTFQTAVEIISIVCDCRIDRPHPSTSSTASADFSSADMTRCTITVMRTPAKQLLATRPWGNLGGSLIGR